MKTSTNPRPYIAPAHQAAHLAGLGVGEKALIVASAKDQGCEAEYLENVEPFPSGEPYTGWAVKYAGQMFWLPRECPLGPVGGTLAVKERWACHHTNDHYRVAFEADGKAVGVMHDGAGGWIHVNHGWVLGLAKHRNDGSWVGRSMYRNVRSAKTMPMHAVRTHLRILSIELRRVGTMTEEEALLWGVSRQWAKSHRVNIAQDQWNADNPAHPWPEAWAWFAAVERMER